MRRKIAKRLKRDILRRGAVISNAHFIKDPGWRRKDCGYAADISYLGWKIGSNGFDMLECWQAGLECMDWTEEEVIKDILDTSDPDKALEEMRDNYPYFYVRAKKEIERIRKESNEL